MRRVWLAAVFLAVAARAAAVADERITGPVFEAVCPVAGGCVVLVQDGGVSANERAYGLLGQALALVRSGNTNRALANLEEAIRLDPTLADAYIGRGFLLHQRGELGRAFADLTQALLLDPDNAYARSVLGDILQAQRDSDGAIAEYEKAIALEPMLARAYLGRGISLASKGDNLRAISDYTTAIRFDPPNDAALRSRGVAYAAIGEVDQAIADFDAAIAIAPVYPRAYINRGLLYARRGELNRAAENFTLALRFDPKSTEAYVLRGIASHYLGNEPQALLDANRGAELSPNMVTAAVWLEIISARRAELAEFASRVDLTPWPGPVVRLMLGEITLEALLAAADGLSPNQRARNVCQATFYAGQLRLLEDAQDQAKALFEKAVVVCPPGFIEWFAAKAELTQIEKG